MIIYEEIFREFQKEKVKYIIVGGIAINLLGSSRNTADLDILVEMSDENLAKIVRILKKRGYRVKQPVDPMGIAEEATRKDWIKNKHMKAFNFYKEDELKEVDIIIDSPVSFKDAKTDIVYIRGGGITYPVISIDNLIKMKKGTGRDVDNLDVKTLRKIKKSRRS
jgi:predicted nucleotidyltransferase